MWIKDFYDDNKRRSNNNIVDLCNFVREWEARERELDMYPQAIVAKTHHLLMNVGMLKFYEEETSLKMNNHFLTQLIHH